MIKASAVRCTYSVLLDGKIERQVANIPEAAPVDQRSQHFSSILTADGIDGIDEFWKRSVVDAVEVSSSQSEGSKPSWHRFGCDGHDVWCVPLSVTDQIQRFGPGVLRPVATHSQLARDAGVQNRQSSLFGVCQKWRQLCGPRPNGSTTYGTRANWDATHNDPRLEQVVHSEGRSEFRLHTEDVLDLVEVEVLVIAGDNLTVSDCPLARAKTSEARERLTDELGGSGHELLASCLFRYRSCTDLTREVAQPCGSNVRAGLAAGIGRTCRNRLALTLLLKQDALQNARVIGFAEFGNVFYRSHLVAVGKRHFQLLPLTRLLSRLSLKVNGRESAKG